MNSSVSAIPQAIKIARATGRISIQNVIFALAVKLLVLVLGFVGFANIWAAVFADTGVAMHLHPQLHADPVGKNSSSCKIQNNIQNIAHPPKS